ncbi:Putative ribosomal N-acetyltransferase YdaF [Caulifigura coniformis]|uniref:Ribosomal N-acetyltransferase YdaF n=1 Tax=Caulifigura coniformis TaxID=2527983 RepID=A0A517SJZ5_9PLAN|nr:GNAT family N-acetyltransferase [Caulifigura coniformis]QDT56441.1 Putative ribosomal N-acetyltransferase YdaF [Caulifigura coniformis]
MNWRHDDWGGDLPVVAAERVVLRPLSEGDTDSLFELFSDREVMRFWSSLPMSSRDDAVALLQEIRDHFAARRLFQWGIADRVSNQVVGTCTLLNLDYANLRAEIGFALNRRYWGTGLAREGVSALVAFAFDTLGLERIEADTDPRNERCRRLLTRLGFREEGLLRERWRVGGEVQDSLILGLLKSEWTTD